jgi:hypothetical protein
VEGKAEFTKHMIRMRHAGQVQTRPEANEIILINSHDGASSYQMLAGMFRFVCCNGLVVGEVVEDIRIGGATSRASSSRRRELIANWQASNAFRRRGEDGVAQCRRNGRQTWLAHTAQRHGPIRRWHQVHPDVSRCLAQACRGRRGQPVENFPALPENALRGGLPGRTVQGRRIHTREVASIDRSIALNRALWVLARNASARQRTTKRRIWAKSVVTGTAPLR